MEYYDNSNIQFSYHLEDFEAFKEGYNENHPDDLLIGDLSDFYPLDPRIIQYFLWREGTNKPRKDTVREIIIILERPIVKMLDMMEGEGDRLIYFFTDEYKEESDAFQEASKLEKSQNDAAINLYLNPIILEYSSFTNTDYIRNIENFKELASTISEVLDEGVISLEEMVNTIGQELVETMVNNSGKDPKPEDIILSNIVAKID